jgi:hypothetical protein
MWTPRYAFGEPLQLRALLAELERTDTFFVFAEPVNLAEVAAHAHWSRVPIALTCARSVALYRCRTMLK